MSGELLSLSWPAAVTIIGLMVAIVGLVIKLAPSKDRQWKDALSELDKKLDRRIATLELNSPNIKQQLDDLKDSIGDHEDDARVEMDKLDKKISRLTDLLIELVSGKK